MNRDEVIKLLLQKYQEGLNKLTYSDLVDTHVLAYKTQLQLADTEQLEVQALLELKIEVKISDKDKKAA